MIKTATQRETAAVSLWVKLQTGLLAAILLLLIVAILLLVFLAFESRKALIYRCFPGFLFFVATNWLQRKAFLVAISSRT